MSTTSGPMLPPITGKSSVLPSGRVRLAFLSMISPIVPTGAKTRHDAAEFCLVSVAAPAHNVEQVVVLQGQDFEQVPVPLIVLQVVLQHEIKLEQPSSAAPLDLLLLEAIHHTDLRTI